MSKGSSLKSLEQILLNPLNSSTSKQQFTFSKQKRFKEKLLTQAPDTYYQIPSTRSKIACSFGKLKKQLIQIPGRISPEPTTYKIESQFDKISHKKSGIKILYGREECKSNSIFQAQAVPGPGTYNPNPQLAESRSSLKFSIQQKLPLSYLYGDKDIPGPGKYNIKSSMLNDNKILSQDKKYIVGKLFYPKNVSQSKISERYPQIQHPQITYKGQKLLKKGEGFSLPKADRFSSSHLKTQTPGPGYYKKFSQFIPERLK